ncbi:MAG: Gfo/Idh/MocA family oxidoreductase [Nitrospinota bacterium]|nr:Gfo/Idh/MocA family oxidoreductase [Nitrospinota bacterium]
MSIDKQIGLGFVGLGWWGSVLAQAAIDSKVAKVEGCFARTEKSREEFAEKFDAKNYSSLDDLLKDSCVDAVVIASSNGVHFEHAISAARAGKHIHLEKPMALRISDAKEIVRACEESNVRLHIGQNFRRWPMFRFAKEQVSAENLGLISIAISQFSGNLGLVSGIDSLRWDPLENPGGPLYSYTIHLSDVMEFLFGEVVEVTANCGKVGGPSMTKDSAASVLRFGSGQVGIISGSYLSPMSFTFEIQGSKANLLLSNAHMPRIQKEGQEAWEAEFFDLDLDFISGRASANAEQFVDLHAAVRTGKTPEVSGIQGVRALAIMRAILLSDLEKRSVSIEEILDEE